MFMKKIARVIGIVLCLVLVFVFTGCQGEKGSKGDTGLSAYEIWLAGGHEGTELDFLEWLKGNTGSSGAAGKSAYELAVENGFKGTLEEWLASLKGESAYDIFMKYNPDYEGDEEQWINDVASGRFLPKDVPFTAISDRNEFFPPNSLSAVFPGGGILGDDYGLRAVHSSEEFVSAREEISDFGRILNLSQVSPYFGENADRYDKAFFEDNSLILFSIYSIRSITYTLVDNIKRQGKTLFIYAALLEEVKLSSSTRQDLVIEFEKTNLIGINNIKLVEGTVIYDDTEWRSNSIPAMQRITALNGYSSWNGSVYSSPVSPDYFDAIYANSSLLPFYPFLPYGGYYPREIIQLSLIESSEELALLRNKIHSGYIPQYDGLTEEYNDVYFSQKALINFIGGNVGLEFNNIIKNGETLYLYALQFSHTAGISVGQFGFIEIDKADIADVSELKLIVRI